MGITKSANIEVTAKTEGAARGLDRVAKSTAKMRNAAEAAGKSQEKMGSRIGRLESSMDKASKSVQRFQNILGAGGLVAVAGLAISKINDLVDRSAKLQAVMGNLPIGIDAARRATQGMVNDFDLAVAASKAVRLGVVENEEQFAKLAGIAAKLGLSIGEDLNKSVADLTTALGRQSPMILDNLGIQLKLSDAYRDYATQLGKTAAELTDTEKKQAFLTIALQKGEAAAKDVKLEVDEGTQAWIRWRTEMQNIADTLLPNFLGEIAKVRNFLVDLNADILSFVSGDTIREAIQMAQFSDEATKGRTNVRGFGGAGGAPAAAANAPMSDLERDYQRQVRDRVARERQKLRERTTQGSRSGRGGRGQPEDIEAINRGLPGNEVADDISGQAEQIAQEQLERERRLQEAKMEIRRNARLRAIEEGLDPIQAIEAERAAEMEFLQFKLDNAETEVDRLLIKDEMEAQMHNSRLQRIAAETRAREEARKSQERTFAAIDNATRAHTNVLRLAAEAGIKSEGRKARAMAAAAGIDATVNAALEVARSIAAFARYDFVAGAGHAAAAAAFTTAAVTAFREAGGGGRGAASTAAPTLGGGFDGGQAANIGPAGGGLGPNTSGNVPTSIPTQGAQRAVAGGGAGEQSRFARGITVNVGEVRTFGETEREKVGKELRDLIDDSDRSLGAA